MPLQGFNWMQNNKFDLGVWSSINPLTSQFDSPMEFGEVSTPAIRRTLSAWLQSSAIDLVS